MAMKQKIRRLRPIVVLGTGGGVTLSSLYAYKSSYETNDRSGWSKSYLTTWKDEYIYGDIEDPIANQTWILGKNLLIQEWYESLDCYTNTGGYQTGNAPYLDESFSTTVTIKALDAAEAEVGTIATLSWIEYGRQEVDIVDYAPLDFRFDFEIGVTGSGAGWKGPAHAFLIDTSWSASATWGGAYINPTLAGTFNSTATSVTQVKTT